MNSSCSLKHTSKSSVNISLARSKRLKASRKTNVPVYAGLEYNKLKGISVVKANTNERVELLSLWQVGHGMNH
jgi:hypothetical protein